MTPLAPHAPLSLASHKRQWIRRGALGAVHGTLPIAPHTPLESSASRHGDGWPKMQVAMRRMFSCRRKAGRAFRALSRLVARVFPLVNDSEILAHGKRVPTRGHCIRPNDPPPSGQFQHLQSSHHHHPKLLIRSSSFQSLFHCSDPANIDLATSRYPTGLTLTVVHHRSSLGP